MKGKKNRRFHIAKRTEIPDLSKAGTAVEIKKKTIPENKNAREKAEEGVLSWDIRRSSGRQREEGKTKEGFWDSRKKKMIRKWLIISVCAAAALTSYLVITLQTYTGIVVLSREREAESGRSGYIRFDKDILCYSRDGIALLDTEGKELWKEDVQIENPVMEANKETAIVVDKGGNSILVFGKKGLRGEIYTELPIERAAVSEKGITAVILKDGGTPRVQCYDAAGNVLIEYKVAAVNSGYPIDVAVSPDGTLLMVSYLTIKNNGMDTELVYYDFGSKKEDSNYKAGGKQYKDTVMPSVFFVSDDKSIAVSDKGFVIYGGSEPKEKKNISLKKEIKSICCDEEYLGFVLKNSGKAGYELRLYDFEGKEVISKDFKEDYGNIKIEDGQILMYGQEKCSIYTETGVHRFEGEMGENIQDIFPLKGVNKYMVVNENGTQTVRLTK